MSLILLRPQTKWQPLEAETFFFHMTSRRNDAEKMATQTQVVMLNGGFFYTIIFHKCGNEML